MWPRKNAINSLIDYLTTANQRAFGISQYFQTSDTNKNKKTTRTSDVYKSKVGHKHGQI